jgi:electron transport complex protein RnfC
VLEAAQRLDLDLADRSGVHACVECGICSYVCPSHLPLLQGIRAVKKELLKAAER